MGIDRTGPVGPLRFASSRMERLPQSDRRPAEATIPREDSIDLSPAAQDIARANPAERDELVHRLRSQVHAGAYRLDPDAVARQMVDRGEV